VQIDSLAIPGAYVISPASFSDERGSFWEWYRFDHLEEVIGHRFEPKQGNASVSRRGTLRGVHFANSPSGQAKYVTVAAGAVIDFIVDVRVGSPTFGQWDSVRLDSVERRAVYLAEGLGHAFLALDDDTVVNYLVSDIYRPTHEHGVTPFDPAIALDLVVPREDLVLSEKDVRAPTLEEAARANLLPRYESSAVSGGPS
jgi:dTDP-4-dehydrorhamnose 3,5-epimerase